MVIDLCITRTILVSNLFVISIQGVLCPALLFYNHLIPNSSRISFVNLLSGRFPSSFESI